MRGRLGAIFSISVLLALPAAVQATLHQTPRVPYLGGPARYADFRWKPSRIIYSGDGAGLLAGRGRLTNHLRWTTWNYTEGRAWGADWHNDCVPDCADGTYFGYRADVHVYRPRQVGGYLLFTRMTITYTGARPPYPAYRHGSVTYKLDYNAQYNAFYWGGG